MKRFFKSNKKESGKKSEDMATEQKNNSTKSRTEQAKDFLENYYVFGQKTEDIRTKYELGEEFSRGHVGRVFTAKDKTNGETRAVKSIEKPKFSRKQQREMFFDAITNEVQVLKKVDHPNVVKLFDVFEDERSIYLVMEMCSGGELFEKIQKKGRFTEKDAADILRQITEAVGYMHSHNIAHCDLKPENLLFASRDENAPLKIVDFGMSKALRWRQYFRSICGTPYYVAPEVLRGHYDESCDLWSIGIIMFVMVFGFPPFYSNDKGKMKSNQEIYEKVTQGFKAKVLPGYGAWFPEKIRASDDVKDLIKHLLVQDVAKRMTAQEALCHPWLKGDTATDEAIDSEVFRSLIKFSKGVQFKQTVTDFMVDQLSADQVATLAESFKKMDKDGDGTVSYSELHDALKEVDVNIDESKVAETLKQLDLDGDGRIDYDELMHARMFRKLAGKETRLWSAFRKMDKNGDGKISPSELLDAVGAEKDLEHAKGLIAELDADGDGNIDYEEFIKVWEVDVERHRSSSDVDRDAMRD